jgi:hypothetical protein
MSPWCKAKAKPKPIRTVKVVFRNNTQTLQFDFQYIRIIDGCLLLENDGGFIVAGFAKHEWNSITEIKKA